MIKLRSVLFFSAIACATFFVSSCGGTTEEVVETAEETEIPETESVEAEWVTITPEDGSFEIKMPSEPEYSFDSIPTAAGVMYYHSWILDNDDQGHACAYFDLANMIELGLELTDERIDKMLEDGLNGGIQSLADYGDQPITDKHERFKFMDKYPAMKAMAHNGEHYVYIKVIMVDTRCYMVWEGKTGAYSEGADVDEFFSSLTLNVAEEESAE